MKKIITVLAISFFANISAQEFKLTPENFKDKADKNFYIFEMPNLNQETLFKKAKIYFTSKYKNLKGDGYNEVEPNQIVLNVASKSATIKALGIAVIGGDFTNRYEISFKDGKVMIKPSFSTISLPDGSGGLQDVYLTGGGLLTKSVFNKKGKVSINEKQFAGIEENTNDFIKQFTDSMSSNSDDW